MTTTRGGMTSDLRLTHLNTSSASYNVSMGTDKTRGIENHEKRKAWQTSKFCRSKHVKQNKIRDARRDADRHGHHRRRNVVRSEMAKGKVEGVEDLPVNSSCNQHGNFGLWGSNQRAQMFSNRKQML